jgi:uncharacterized spore protein YtfJ
MEKDELMKLVYSVSAAKFFGVNKNSQLHKQVVEVVETISTKLEKEKTNEQEEKTDSVQR